MKDEGELVIAFIIEMLIIDKSADIGGHSGWLVFLLANAVLLMFCIYQYRHEQDHKRERRKVIEAAEHIRRAYEAKEGDDRKNRKAYRRKIAGHTCADRRVLRAGDPQRCISRTLFDSV